MYSSHLSLYLSLYTIAIHVYIFSNNHENLIYIVHSKLQTKTLKEKHMHDLMHFLTCG